ncbi:cell number regulator 6-like [Hibiscus syriacus]|uniref:cell number regulator 6-like n=1 Tax=Hibiscus syriacus TaxID=106335 RepID=UPI001920EE7A|nr:cell number regulator 6-like [Hibiscus syriacus]
MRLNKALPYSQREHFLILHRCPECGQPLPESYVPLADEDWTTGIFGCLQDTQSCRMGMFCPCVLFGQNVETLREDVTRNDACMCHALCVEGGMAAAAATLLFHGIDPQTSFLICETLLFAWWLCGIYNGLFRQSLQKKYHLKNSPCDPCLVHCFLHWCALCQEHREMRNHVNDNTETPITVIKPPPVQEMNTTVDEDNQKDDQPIASSSSTAKDQQIAELEIQSL